MIWGFGLALSCHSPILKEYDTSSEMPTVRVTTSRIQSIAKGSPTGAVAVRLAGRDGCPYPMLEQQRPMFAPNNIDKALST